MLVLSSHLLTWVRVARAGKKRKARKMYTESIRLAPNHEYSHQNLGAVLALLGRVSDAATAYSAAAELNPSQASHPFLIGALTAKLGRTTEAMSAFQKAALLNPRDAEIQLHFGDSAFVLKQWREAEGAYSLAAALAPRHELVAQTHLIIGNLRAQRGDAHTASEAYQKSLAISPQQSSVWSRLGAVLWTAGNYAQANISLNQAVRLNPRDYEAMQLSASLHYHSGMHTVADQILEGALRSLRLETATRTTAADDNSTELFSPLYTAIEIGKAVSIPTIMPNVMEMRSLRTRASVRLLEILKRLTASTAVNGTLSRSVIADFKGLVPPPNWPYWLEMDRFPNMPVYTMLGSAVRLTYPDLSYIAPHCVLKPRPVYAGRQAQLKLGFVSSCFHKHTLAKMFGEVISGLRTWRPRSEAFDEHSFTFEVIIFTFEDSPVDSFTRNIAPEGSRHVILPMSDLQLAREAIAAEELDILVYNDISISRVSYFLAFARLANIQALTLNNGMTSGLWSLDYYISSIHTQQMQAPASTQGAAQEAASTLYAESLVLLDAMPYFLPGPVSEVNEVVSRDTFGLPQSNTSVFMCLQAPFKLHPLFDVVITTILSQNADAYIVFLRGDSQHHEEALRARLTRAANFKLHFQKQIVFISPLPHARFLSLARLATAHLDPFPFGGGYSSGELLSLGMPVITFPSIHRSGRLTSAMYRKMGVWECCVVNSTEQYLSTARRLAKDSDWRSHITKQIMENRWRYSEPEARRRTVDAWGSFLVKAATY
jgi:protein O-GlcNAc transferase